MRPILNFTPIEEVDQDNDEEVTNETIDEHEIRKPFNLRRNIRIILRNHKIFLLFVLGILIIFSMITKLQVTTLIFRNSSLDQIMKKAKDKAIVGGTKPSTSSAGISSSTSSKASTRGKSKLFDGSDLTPKKHFINGLELFVLNPSSASTSSLKNYHSGVVLLLHGCTHDGIDWFKYPQEQVILRDILSRGLTAIAISSPQRTGSKCWDTKPNSQDAAKVSKALRILLRQVIPSSEMRHHFDHWLYLSKKEENATTIPPLYAIGASSGGTFLPFLASEVYLDGVISIIASSYHFENVDIRNMPPRISFISMIHDTFASPDLVSKLSHAIEKKYNETKVLQYTCHPRRVNAGYLQENIQMSRDDTKQVMSVLPLDEKGYLSSNPKSFFPTINEVLPFDHDVRHALFEVLNVAFAQHEITSQYVKESLNFIMSK